MPYQYSTMTDREHYRRHGTLPAYRVEYLLDVQDQIEDMAMARRELADALRSLIEHYQHLDELTREPLPRNAQPEEIQAAMHTLEAYAE